MRGHVGARAELEAVTADIMLESLAAWKSARDVAWPAHPEKEESPATGEAQKPAA